MPDTLALSFTLVKLILSVPSVTLILLNVFVINAYPALADFVLILSAYAIVLSLVLRTTGMTGKLPVILGVLVFMVFHWAITGWNQPVPGWLSWLENPGVQSLIIIGLTFFTVISFITRKGSGGASTPETQPTTPAPAAPGS